jgi:hypothetical protein
MILAIDPGNTESGFALISSASRRPVVIGKVGNEEILDVIDRNSGCQHIAIEMIQSFGMAVGADVFETCVWVGRFYQQSQHVRPGAPVELIYRRAVKIHHCGSAKATDANIAQALIDRFAHGVPNRGKGSKAQPGWFYGFAKDIWQAYALAVLVADRQYPLEQPRDQLSLVGAP